MRCSRGRLTLGDSSAAFSRMCIPRSTGAFRDVIRQLRIFFAIGLNERLCSRERFLCISEAGKMLVNEGVLCCRASILVRRLLSRLFDGIFRRRFFGAFYCFARLGDDWFLGYEFLGLFYGLRRRFPAKSQGYRLQSPAMVVQR